MTTALIVIDMLKDFVHGSLANPAIHPTIDRIQALIEQTRGREDWRVIYSNDCHQPGDFELKIFGEHAMAGTSGAEVIEPLAPRPGDIIVPKRFYSAFTQTDLDATCRVHKIDHVVLVGQHTDCCVRHTSYDAMQRGIAITVAADATAIFEPMSEEAVHIRQERALDYIRTFYGAQIVPIADLLEH